MNPNHRSKASSVALDEVAEDELAQITALLRDQFGVKAKRSGIVRYALRVLLPKLQRIAEERGKSDLTESRFRAITKQIELAHQTRMLTTPKKPGGVLEALAEGGRFAGVARKMLREKREAAAAAATTPRQAAEDAFNVLAA